MAPTKRASARLAAASTTKKNTSKDAVEKAKKVGDTKKVATKRKTKKELSEKDRKQLGLEREKECVLGLVAGWC